MFQHILVPTDGSQLSELAVAKAIELALAMKAKLTFVTVIAEMPHGFSGHEGMAIEDTRMPGEIDHLKEKARSLLQKPEQAARAAGVDCGCAVLTGTAPYEGIINASGELHCDLILMASHGYRGLKAMVLGSETHKVLTHSKIPVLVYR